jgi:uncharacterized membrane protein
MGHVLAILYDSRDAARHAGSQVRKLAKGHLLTLVDMVVAERVDDRIVLDQRGDAVTGSVLGGAFLGSLVGYAFLTPIVGIVGGAALGAVGGLISETGLDDTFMREISIAIDHGQAVLFLLVDDVVMEKLAPRLADEGGSILYSSLAPDVDEILLSAFKSTRDRPFMIAAKDRGASVPTNASS